MANRTFKVYGQAYAASGDVNVTMTVNGTQVFSGAVNDSTTVRSGPPSIENHLWTYELDENTTGNFAVSIVVTGGELCLGYTESNLNKTQLIPDSWFVDNADTLTTPESQAYMATQVGQALTDELSPGLYDRMMAGTASNEDAIIFVDANKQWGPRSSETFKPTVDVRNNLQINGDPEAAPIANADTSEDQSGWWPILQDGETLTYTWVFDPDADAV